MMKKFFLFALALTIFAACNDDNDNGPDFETVNDEIVNGQIVDDDEMLFLGTSIVTNPDGTTFTDEYARISIFGDNRPTLITPATTLTLRMHGARFAANMPALEMQLPNLGYTPGVGPPTDVHRRRSAHPASLHQRHGLDASGEVPDYRPQRLHRQRFLHPYIHLHGLVPRAVHGSDARRLNANPF